jgi:AraC-like DNA-binding protein
MTRTLEGMLERLPGVDDSEGRCHAPEMGRLPSASLSKGAGRETDMDVLTDVMRTTQVRGAILNVSRLTGRWGIRIRPGEFVGFHLVTQGDAWIRVAKAPPRRLLQGDLVLVPGGAVHTVSDRPETPAIDLAELCARATTSASSAGTTLVCGAFRSETGRSPLFSLLPPFLHLKAADVRKSPPLEGTLRLLLDELESARPGREVLVDRLVDAFLIYVLRAWVEGQEDGAAGWLGALGDSVVGRAIALVHGEPARRWSVESLAEAVGISRAAFAKRFTQLVGMPPLAYVTRWRVELALQQLRETDRTLASIASDVGYESVFAFSRAFKRLLGASPSAYRRTV